MVSGSEILSAARINPSFKNFNNIDDSSVLPNIKIYPANQWDKLNQK